MLTYEFTYSPNITDEDYDELAEKAHYNFLVYNNLWIDPDMPIYRTARLVQLREDWIIVVETWKMRENKKYITANRAKKTAYYESLGMYGY